MSVFDGLKFRKIHSPIHDLDPRIKFIYVCVIFSAAIIFYELLLLIMLFFIQIPFIFLAGVKREWLRSMKGLTFLAFIIFFTNFIATLIGSEYMITVENLENAIALTLRFIVLAESFSIFFLTTSPDDLGLALEQTHIPYEFCFAFTTAVRFVPILAEEAKTIIDAQKARGLELEGKNFLKRIRNYIPILIPLIVNSIRRSLELAEAMESRAWGGTKKRTNLYKLQIRKGDYVLLFFTIVIIITIIYIKIYISIPNMGELLNKLI